MRTLIVVALLLSLAVGAYSFMGIQSIQQDLRALRTEINNLQDDLRTLHLPLEAGEVALYFVEVTPTDFLLKKVVRQVPYVPNPVMALRELLQGPYPTDELEPSIPVGTRLLGLEITGDLATADFSRELRDNFNGGAQLESLLVTAIVNTLTEFEQIKRVQILLEGEQVESLGGHVTVDQPLLRPDN